MVTGPVHGGSHGRDLANPTCGIERSKTVRYDRSTRAPKAKRGPRGGGTSNGMIPNTHESLLVRALCTRTTYSFAASTNFVPLPSTNVRVGRRSRLRHPGSTPSAACSFRTLALGPVMSDVPVSIATRHCSAAPPQRCMSRSPTTTACIAISQ